MSDVSETTQLPAAGSVALPGVEVLAFAEDATELHVQTSPHPVDLYLQRKAATSKRSLRSSLDLIAATLSDGEADAYGIPWHRVRFEHASAAMDRISTRYAPATANHALSALRGVMKACWRLGLISVEELARATDLEPTRGSRLAAGRDLSPGEIRALFLTCAADEGPAGARDAAMIAVLYAAGVRRSECAALELADLSRETGQLRVRSGKGNKDRLTYVQGAGLLALEAWLEERGGEEGPLFVPVSWSGRVHVRRMTDQAIYARLQKRALQAGVESFSPHDLRRTFAGDLLDAGVDINTVKELLGHASVNTTQHYDRRGERAKQKAAGVLHVPYVRS